MEQSTEHGNLTKHLEWFPYKGTESTQQREDGCFTMNFMMELEHDMPKNETRALLFTIYKNQLQGEQIYKSPKPWNFLKKYGADVSGCWHGNWGERASLDDSKSQVTLAEVTREWHQPVKASTQKRKRPQNEWTTYRMEKTVNALLQGFWISRIRTRNSNISVASPK